jgi:hypothetical protein
MVMIESHARNVLSFARWTLGSTLTGAFLGMRSVPIPPEAESPPGRPSGGGSAKLGFHESTT